MFADTATIKIKAGNGGNGAVAFHREKYVNAGGPDGGDGGHGGNILFRANDHLSTLADFRYKRKYSAPNGDDGSGKNCSGKTGENLIIDVPRGTLIKDTETGLIIADISSDEPVIVAKGGRGGWGNQHFATPTRQIPRFAKPGNPGEALSVTLELKLLADVGLVGFPNVGKSTLISVVSEAKPVIANYHFTTITPVLGIVRITEGFSFVMADIPGIIEGASDGLGLGFDFLRHIERCRMLIHIVDIAGSEERNPIEDFEKINSELLAFNPELAARPMIVAGNKCDLATDEQIAEFKEYAEQKGYEFFPIMAAISEGVKPLISKTAEMLSKLPPVKVYEPDYIKPEVDYSAREFKIIPHDDVYFVEAEWLVSIMNSVNFEDYESMQYFQRVLIKSGIIDALKKAGCNEGDTVSIYELEFDFVL